MYCSGCDTYKDLDCFTKQTSSKYGVSGKCRECRKGEVIKNRTKRLYYHKQKNYGISKEEYQALYEKQGGVCAICKQPETAITKGVQASLCVDHDHETGEVRGLLCSSCNSALGHFRDNTEILARAIDYLKEHNATPKARKKKQAEPKAEVSTKPAIEDLPLFKWTN